MAGLSKRVLENWLREICSAYRDKHVAWSKKLLGEENNKKRM
jgi:hypothetical protein